MRLTAKQKDLLANFEAECVNPSDWVEGFPEEIRTARSLVRKGLITMTEPSAPFGHFEFKTSKRESK